VESERVELVRRAYRDFRRGSFDLDLVHPDAVWDLTARVFDPRIYRGRDGVREFVRDALEVWEEWFVEPEQIMEGPDTVVAAVHTRARGRGSGVVVEDRAVNVWRFQDGKVIGFKVYRDLDEALRSAGIGSP